MLFNSGCKWLVMTLVGALCIGSAVGYRAVVAQEATAAQRPGEVPVAPVSAYRIEIALPIVGSRDETIQRQISQVAAKSRAGQRPVVLLDFVAARSTDPSSGNNSGGTTFERALSLARFLTSPTAAKVRLIAYVSQPIEGHAVLPVLACEDIIVSEEGELGRATVDETKVDEVIRGAYREIVKARQPLWEAAVSAMLDPNVEVYELELVDGSKQVATGQEAKSLRDAGQVISQSPLWSGGGLASFSADTLRKQGWVAKVVSSSEQLPTALGISGRIQNVLLQPDQWNAARLEIADDLNAARVNQFIRSIGERQKKSGFNLLILEINDVRADFGEALRLANYLQQLKIDGIRTAAIIKQSCATSILLPAVVCDQVVVLNPATLGSVDRKPGMVATLSDGTFVALDALEQATNRPMGLLTAALDPDCTVKLYVHKDHGKQRPLADWQLRRLPRADEWVPNETLSREGTVPAEIALRYGLVDSIVDNQGTALRELGVEGEPELITEPYLETVIQRMLAFEWLPRMLVMIGFMALMIEMGSPGLGLGGFVSALCFLAFFWIEGLNGNVAWLEVILFLAGMTSLAIELFVLPGVGIFGIGGGLMVLASIVLASQTFVFPSNSEQLTLIANNLFWVAICALMVVVGAVAMSRRLESTPMLKYLSIEPAGTDDVAELEAREAIVHWEHLLGQDGLTTTRLNPGGKAQFGRMIVNVLGTTMINEGVAVRVVEVRGNSVFVEPLE